ncbi:hypothetical protein ACFL4T_10460, partial [candidate division KSB1 bacterium]
MFKSLTLFFIISIFYLCIFCQSENKTYIPNQNPERLPISKIDSLIFEELKTKKIVMLGDYIHAHEAPYRTLVNSLRYWLEQVKNNTEDFPTKLILFLEAPPQLFEKINFYFTTDDLTPCMNLWTDAAYSWNDRLFTVEGFEFYYELKNILNKISEINLKREKNKIELLIKPAESDPPYDHHLRLTKENSDFLEESFLYFARERDKNSANNIKRILNENKNFKAIVFIGAAHLSRRKTNKRDFVRKRMQSTNKQPENEYFLAYNLDRIYGRNNVSTFFIRGSTNNKKGAIIINFEKRPEDYDIMAVVNIIPPIGFPLPFLKSEIYLKSIFDLISKHSKKTTEIDTI